MEKECAKRERNYPTTLNLPTSGSPTATNQHNECPILEIQSPKTPTLSRKLKAVSLDSDPKQSSGAAALSSSSTSNLDVGRDVFSMPNTPKRQIRHNKFNENSYTNNNNNNQAKNLTPGGFSSNLKKFASNTSISGSQTLKTLPEIMTLQDFAPDSKQNQVRIKTKGLLERRGSNASLTIDLGGSNSSIAEKKDVQAAAPPPVLRLNTAKSVSNLNLSTFGTQSDAARFCCGNPAAAALKSVSERRKSQEACNNCTIYESIPKCGAIPKRCNNCCNVLMQCRRKSLSNENLYVPPCGFCQRGAFKECTKQCKGYRKACYPRQADLDANAQLSEDFKMHLQSVQYLQTAGSVLSISDLKAACELGRVPKLHAEFWEVPLNLQEKCYVSGSQSRNRYKGVLPNEHSRVHLTEGAQQYIHANFIKGPDYTETAYVATQGPMAHTCQDFWEMVWQTNCTSIVMLTGLIEKGRSKCELYFPLGKKPSTHATIKTYYRVRSKRERDKFTFNTTHHNQTTLTMTNFQQHQDFHDDEEVFEFEELNEVEFGTYRIRYQCEEQLDECTIRHLEVTNNATNETRSIRHYWFPNWQDHKVSNPEQLLKMAMHLLNLPIVRKRTDETNLLCNEKLDVNKGGKTVERRKSSDNGTTSAIISTATPPPPIIVHCSAGIGRTGCFLAILNGIQQLNMNLNVDVLAILCSLRLNRGGMVQTAEQYELIHRVLNLYVDLM